MKSTDVELERLRIRREARRAALAADTRVAVEREGRAVCLSGGGYRAALFHLGALLRLHESGLLAGVTMFSSVSGGSIVSAWLACRYLDTRLDGEAFAAWSDRIDFSAVVVEPFRAVVARDIRTAPVLATVAYNWLWPSHRIGLLERRYAEVFGERTLDELPESPAFVFCATDLTFGVNWEFSRRRVGDYLAGYLRDGARRVGLACAVAASSSFPPVFGPVRFDTEAGDYQGGHYQGDDGDELRARIELSDGGVYDNLATEPALRRYREVLVSDAGGPFAFETRRWWLQRLLRYTQVVGNQAEALRKRLFFGQAESGSLTGVYWSLNGSRDEGADGYSPALVREVIGRFRTDLDRFLDPEFEVLVNHGYFAAVDAMWRQNGWHPDSTQSANWPYPQRADESEVRRLLRHSHRRVLHRRWWGAS
ncbi:patatin-like phospholipase family protein [Lysobacter antibioticus]|uniref:Patatin-like phospholipase family protein n=1 Tax=Lysobacter antibioticus TaxID=84531 RepID=A0A0S2E2J4_LYSAN|nr:patatin-like phospholipase family protein [Lysobacter antibioticus]ALN64983.1 patatin-like phospholipase family protein [Lysobacter antibioticus]ALN78479.1 patatin-like phospholipase family protein [Lysobacter antibioticus]